MKQRPSKLRKKLNFLILFFILKDADCRPIDNVPPKPSSHNRKGRLKKASCSLLKEK